MGGCHQCAGVISGCSQWVCHQQVPSVCVGSSVHRWMYAILPIIGPLSSIPRKLTTISDTWHLHSLPVYNSLHTKSSLLTVQLAYICRGGGGGGGGGGREGGEEREGEGGREREGGAILNLHGPLREGSILYP